MTQDQPETVAAHGIQHRIRVVQARATWYSYPYAAGCSCGWLSAYCRDRVEARADAEAHCERLELRGETVDYDSIF